MLSELHRASAGCVCPVTALTSLTLTATVLQCYVTNLKTSGTCFHSQDPPLRSAVCMLQHLAGGFGTPSWLLHSICICICCTVIHWLYTAAAKLVVHCCYVCRTDHLATNRGYRWSSRQHCYALSMAAVLFIVRPGRATDRATTNKPSNMRWSPAACAAASIRHVHTQACVTPLLAEGLISLRQPYQAASINHAAHTRDREHSSALTHRAHTPQIACRTCSAN